MLLVVFKKREKTDKREESSGIREVTPIWYAIKERDTCTNYKGEDFIDFN